MATIEKANVFNQLSIAVQIIDGSINIDSTSEFENVLQIFPNDPALLRAYGDLLVVKKSPDVAAQSFAKAARLFVDSGMMLQSIVSKCLQWKISPPSNPGEIREFFATIKNAVFHETPVNAFFHKLEYQALVAILFPLVKIRLPNEELSLNVKGTVIWSRLINIEEETTVALGMRFQKMSPQARGMLLGFANSLEKFEEIPNK